MELLRASLVLVIALPAALSHQLPFHSHIISLAPLADATVFRDRTGYSHTQILPSGPNYHHPQRVIQRVVTEAVPVVHHPLVAHHPIVAHHPVVHQAIVHQPVAHHPIVHHAPPPVLVTVQKAASPLVYHSYAPITTYAKPTAYESHYPATLTTTYKQPAYAAAFPTALAYKHPVTTTKIIETHPQVVTAHQATYVPPIPTGRAVVTSYFNVPGGGRRAGDANFPSWTRTTTADTPNVAVPDPLVSVSTAGARLQGQVPTYGTDSGWRRPVASAYSQSAWPARLVAVSMKRQGHGGFYRSRYPVPTRLEDWPASFKSSARSRLVSGQAVTKQGWDYGNQAQSKWSTLQDGNKRSDDEIASAVQDSAGNYR